MAKLRNVQFYRNGSPANVANHSAARTNAQTVFNGQIASMQDGEMLLYRYTIGSDTTVHTITGVVRRTGASAGYVEIMANADMFSTAAFTGNASDVTYSTATSGLTATDVQGAIDEVEGRVDTLETEILELNSTIGEINAVYGVKINDTELVKDGNKKVTIATDGTYDASTNKIATESTVGDAIADLDSIADADTASGTGYATVTTTTPSTDFKVLNSVTEVDGKLTAADAYNVKKVAATAEASDLYKSTNSTATYDTTPGEVSSDWISVVNGNALEDGNTVDADLNKLDVKIAGLADEMIDKEQVTTAAFNAVKGSVGLENNFSLDLAGTAIIGSDTNVKGALVDLANAISGGSSKVKDVEVDGTSVVAANGVAGIFTDTNSLYNESANKIATVGTVNTAIGNLNTTIGAEFAALDANSVMGVAYTAADSSNGAKLTFKGVSEEDGLIKQGIGEEFVQFAKIATEALASNFDVNYTYANSVTGVITGQEATTDITNRLSSIEGQKFDTVVATDEASTPQGVKWMDGSTKITGTLVPTAATMHKIYLVHETTAGGAKDVFGEYITYKTGNAYDWEKVGTTEAEFDPTGYVKTITVNNKAYDTNASHNTVLGTYVTDVNATNGGYITLTKGAVVVDPANGTAVLPLTVGSTVVNVANATASNMGLAEASDVKSYVDDKVSTTIQGLDKANSTVGANVQVSYEEADGIVTITNVAGPNANPTSDDAAVAKVQVVQTDGKITDVVVTTNAISVDATNLSVNSTTGAVTGDNIANIKSYIDSKAGTSTTTVNGVEGITVTDTPDTTTGAHKYTVNAKVSENAVSGSTTTPSAAANLLVINSNHELAVSDTWDCGEY